MIFVFALLSVTLEKNDCGVVSTRRFIYVLTHFSLSEVPVSSNFLGRLNLRISLPVFLTRSITGGMLILVTGFGTVVCGGDVVVTIYVGELPTDTHHPAPVILRTGTRIYPKSTSVRFCPGARVVVAMFLDDAPSRS